MAALTRKFVLAPDVDLLDMAERCPRNFTGADMYALASDAWLAALKRTVSSLPEALSAVPEKVSSVTACDFRD